MRLHEIYTEHEKYTKMLTFEVSDELLNRPQVRLQHCFLDTSRRDHIKTWALFTLIRSQTLLFEHHDY
jgi:hypothetical protein